MITRTTVRSFFNSCAVLVCRHGPSDCRELASPQAGSPASRAASAGSVSVRSLAAPAGLLRARFGRLLRGLFPCLSSFGSSRLLGGFGPAGRALCLGSLFRGGGALLGRPVRCCLLGLSRERVTGHRVLRLVFEDLRDGLRDLRLSFRRALALAGLVGLFGALARALLDLAFLGGGQVAAGTPGL